MLNCYYYVNSTTDGNVETKHYAQVGVDDLKFIKDGEALGSTCPSSCGTCWLRSMRPTHHCPSSSGQVSSYFGDGDNHDNTNYYVTKITPNDFKNSFEEARNATDPLEVYVERLAALSALSHHLCRKRRTARV